MTDLKNIKTALIKIKDSGLHIVIGKNLITIHDDYHNQVSFEIHGGGNEVLVKGKKVRMVTFSETITEFDKNFNFYCENLQGFKEKIETKRKFSWKKLKFESYKYVWHSWLTDYQERTYLYKEEGWKRVEYKTNNWVFEEI
jgi:hypothetical protein